MKRSEINASIDRAIAFFDEQQLPLPAWARWHVPDWQQAGAEYDEIRRLRLGWDVTDFGSGDLANIGRTIFTLRNGPGDGVGHPRSYAEKVMCLFPGQRSVIHCHRSKCEDIICRRGCVCIELWNEDESGKLADTPVMASVDGVATTLAAGEILRLTPGMSVLVPPRLYHRFWGEGDGPTLSIEVSSVCNDLNDNVFLDRGGERFPEIEEDEPRRWVLCSEYAAARADAWKATGS
jgi:D-lyxose ketol-isomerase